MVNLIKINPGATTKPAYDKFILSDYSATSYTHTPFKSVYFVAAGVSESETAFRKDATAARAHALLGVINDDQAHIDKAIQIMNDWALTMEGWTADNSAQPQLETAWGLPIWIAAADIIQYYGVGQPGGQRRSISKFNIANFKKFAGMLYSEARKSKDRLSNWGASANLAMISYGAYIDDPLIVQEAIDKTKYLISYMSTRTGLNPEVCRDTVHPQYTNVALLQIAEIAHNLGRDEIYDSKIGISNTLFIPAFLEYYAKLFLGYSNDPCNGVWTQPNAPAAGYSYYGEWNRYDLYAIGYNHYIKRKNSIDLPVFQLMLKNFTPTKTYTDNHFILWGLLTHSID